ncbi:MAG TPA: hypothetical protein VMR74_14390 [Gammaproteobacteria bacterium]|nr:hypothetical protein [Gammaproteobacteria bacterium]
MPEQDAVELAPLIDQGAKGSAVLTKILTAGRSPIPVAQVYLQNADADVSDAATVESKFARGRKSSPAVHRSPAPWHRPTSILMWLLLALLIGLILVVCRPLLRLWA